MSRYQKGKTNQDFLEQEIVSDNGISWAICKSAHHLRQMTMPESHHTHTHNRFTALLETALLEYVWDHPGEQVPER